MRIWRSATTEPTSDRARTTMAPTRMRGRVAENARRHPAKRLWLFPTLDTSAAFLLSPGKCGEHPHLKDEGWRLATRDLRATLFVASRAALFQDGMVVTVIVPTQGINP